MYISHVKLRMRLVVDIHYQVVLMAVTVMVLPVFVLFILEVRLTILVQIKEQDI